MSAPDFLVHPPAAVDVLVPDGTSLEAALARTTTLGVGAHPDDLELLAIGAIGDARESADRWFSGVTVTDGAGAVLGPELADLDAAELVARRRQEQRNAARVGRYGLQVQLGHRSSELRSPDGRTVVAEQLRELLLAGAPTTVLTHAPVDRHDTHVGVALAVVEACRSLPPGRRPSRVLGVEVWRSLDWLSDDDKVRLDVTGHGDLAQRLAEAHASQLSAKRYDLAMAGRRRANATLDDPRAPDAAEEVVLALDLGPMVDDPALSLGRYVDVLVGRLRADLDAVRGSLGA